MIPTPALLMGALLSFPTPAMAISGPTNVRSGAVNKEQRVLGRYDDQFTVILDRRMPGTKRPPSTFRFETLVVAMDRAVYSDGIWQQGEIRLLPPGFQFPGNTYIGAKERVKVLVKAGVPYKGESSVSSAQALSWARELLTSASAPTTQKLLAGRHITASVLVVPTAAVVDAGTGPGRFWITLSGTAKVDAHAMKDAVIAPAPSGKVRVTPAAGGFATLVITVRTLPPPTPRPTPSPRATK